jgi:hypothetical protein
MREILNNYPHKIKLNNYLQNRERAREIITMLIFVNLFLFLIFFLEIQIQYVKKHKKEKTESTCKR